jgi:hypothetical protein
VVFTSTLCHPRDFTVVLAALVPRHVPSSPATSLVSAVLEGRDASLTQIHTRVGNHNSHIHHVDQSSPGRAGSSETYLDRYRRPRPRRQVKQHRFRFDRDHHANTSVVAQDGKQIHTPHGLDTNSLPLSLILNGQCEVWSQNARHLTTSSAYH